MTADSPYLDLKECLTQRSEIKGNLVEENKEDEEAVIVPQKRRSKPKKMASHYITLEQKSPSTFSEDNF